MPASRAAWTSSVASCGLVLNPGSRSPSGSRDGGWVLAEQTHAALVDLVVVPRRFREEPLQPLDFAVLGTGDRLGAGQPGQRLVAVAWQQQALQVVAEAAPLGQAREEHVELLGVGLQRARRGRTGTASGHRGGRLSWRTRL